MPSRFAICGSLNERNAMRIVEDQLGGLKIDAVLRQVTLVLFLVPFKSNHTYVHSSTYSGLTLRDNKSGRTRGHLIPMSGGIETTIRPKAGSTVINSGSAPAKNQSWFR